MDESAGRRSWIRNVNEVSGIKIPGYDDQFLSRECMLPDHLRRYRPLIVLLGPTAVGKSRVGTQVAKHFDTEVLTADSRQVYRGMDIGTDKPTAAERQGVPHRLLDMVDPHEVFNAGWYRRVALDEIDRLYAANRLPFVVGGTGLYIRT